ncbi:MAG: hypothetical protein ALECFALPRED_009331 [Alectoria fallacina]|uniref:Ubiquitin-conjugating enzyme E2 2 n=1 Tax=Alectoria fallacina TaxID=1903189 RepID=A0A8H3EYS9_9LECA|nr:MAG: hypothetical protein ALECFALPRED_009331 [Alectoria fallacina]
MAASKILQNEYKALSQEKWVNVELNSDDIFNWNVALIVINPDSLYYGGYFKAKMNFPHNYPYTPPSFQFNRALFHPNIYADGKLCISILHAPGDDEMSGESAGERWSPAQRVESILLSIISLLDDAECSSPANVDAGVMLRKDSGGFKKKVKADVEKSKEDIPAGFVMPTHESTAKIPEKPVDDREFWVDSDEEDDFGGSDTDAEMTEDGDDGLPDDEDQEEGDDEDHEENENEENL